MSLESEIFGLGRWANFEELEENITLAELNTLVEHLRKKEHEHFKFMAALQGVDLDKNRKDEAFEAVRLRAQAEITGKSEEELTLNKIGIAVETL